MAAMLYGSLVLITAQISADSAPTAALVGFFGSATQTAQLSSDHREAVRQCLLPRRLVRSWRRRILRAVVELASIAGGFAGYAGIVWMAAAVEPTVDSAVRALLVVVAAAVAWGAVIRVRSRLIERLERLRVAARFETFEIGTTHALAGTDRMLWGPRERLHQRTLLRRRWLCGRRWFFGSALLFISSRVLYPEPGIDGDLDALWVNVSSAAFVACITTFVAGAFAYRRHVRAMHGGPVETLLVLASGRPVDPGELRFALFQLWSGGGHPDSLHAGLIDWSLASFAADAYEATGDPTLVREYVLWELELLGYGSPRSEFAASTLKDLQYALARRSGPLRPDERARILATATTWSSHASRPDAFIEGASLVVPLSAATGSASCEDALAAVTKLMEEAELSTRLDFEKVPPFDSGRFSRRAPRVFR